MPHRERLFRLVAHEDAGWGSAEVPVVACAHCGWPWRYDHRGDCEITLARRDLGVPERGLDAEAFAAGLAAIREGA